MKEAMDCILHVMAIKDKQARELVLSGNNNPEREDNIQRAEMLRGQIADLQTALNILKGHA